MPKFITLFVISLLLIAIIASGLAFFTAPLLGYWQGFAGWNVLCWAGAFGYRHHQISIENRLQLEYQNRQDFIDDRNIANINCPCGRSTITKALYVNDIADENVFSCTVCNGTYKVEITAEPILTTTPLHVDSSVQLFDKLKATAEIVGPGMAITL